MHPGAHAATNPDKPAIVMAGSGEVVTYGQLDVVSLRTLPIDPMQEVPLRTPAPLEPCRDVEDTHQRIAHRSQPLPSRRRSKPV